MLNFTRPGDPLDLVENTQGRPMSPHDEMRVVDERGAPVPPGEEGELLVRGPYTLNGYYRAEEANARSFSPDGFYRTGDRVRIFADGERAGYVEVTGRIKDVIHRGGETVSATDLEDHLLAHPAVYSAAAVALPDRVSRRKNLCSNSFQGSSHRLGGAEPVSRRTWRLQACPPRRAGADAVAAHNGGGQGGQEEGRRGDPVVMAVTATTIPPARVRARPPACR